MSNIRILNREMTPEELKRTYQGFDEQTTELGVEIQTSDRISYTVIIEDKFIGCSSELAYKI